jgi:hypothetical protein
LRVLKSYPLEEFGEMCSNATKVVDELAVLACKTKEATKCTKRTWCLPLHHALDLVKVHVNTLCVDDMTKVRHLFLAEETFGALEAKAVILDKTKYCPNMTQVI